MMNNTKQKILIFSTAYYPFVGGAEIAIKEITDRFPEEFSFDLITAKFQKDLQDVEKVGRVNVYRVGSGSPFFDKIFLPFRGALLAHRLQKTEDYFCIWAMMVTFGSLAGYIFNIARGFRGEKKIPVVLTLQEGDSENHLQYKWGGLIALSWKLSLRQTTVLTGISNFLLNRAKKNGYKGKSVLIPNGVDLVVFSREIDQEVKNQMRVSLNKNSGDTFLVTVGRLTHKNAVDDIISALVRLPENVSLVVIGKGEQGQRLQKQAKDLGVSNRVKFLGFIAYEDIPKYFSVCDIFIRSSRSEGFGNSFIEAMAAHLPVIGTPVGGIVDFIDDKETGIFCSPDNPASIVQAVNLYLGDDNLKRYIIDKAYNRVSRRYGWDYISLEMRAVFETLVKIS